MTVMVQERPPSSDSYQREPVLTAAQERAYITQAQRGDQDAMEHLVRANIGWIAFLARTMPIEHGARQEVLEDLIQEGCVGLMAAVQQFDLARPLKLNTYATWKIRQAMHRYLENTCTPIRLPVYLHPIKHALKRTQNEQDDAALAAYPVHAVEEVRQAMRPVRSLDALVAPHRSSTLTLGDILADNATSTEESVLEEMQGTNLDAALEVLSERERRILRALFGLDDGIEHTLESLGKREGVTRERVRQIKMAALAKLRHSWLARTLLASG